MNRSDTDDDINIRFTVWPKDGTDTDGREYTASIAGQAAQQCARDDLASHEVLDGPRTYCARDNETGQIWEVAVGVAMQPTFVTLEAREVLMPPATHVLWGNDVLCSDLRLRSWSQRDWPEGQRAISLDDVRVGVVPEDRCDRCWAAAPGLVAELLELIAKKHA